MRKLRVKSQLFCPALATVGAQSKTPMYWLVSLRDCPNNMMPTIKILQSWMYSLTPQQSWCSQVSSVNRGSITFQVLEGLWDSALGWASSQLWNWSGFAWGLPGNAKPKNLMMTMKSNHTHHLSLGHLQLGRKVLKKTKNFECSLLIFSNVK